MITSDQYQKIAKDLERTNQNVYTVAARHGVTNWTDADFDVLRQKHQLFKCNECDEWKDLSEEVYADADLCLDCYG